MDLTKTARRGTFKMAYSPRYRIAAYQWNDSKVVNCVSSYLDFRVKKVQRRVGSTTRTYDCPSALVHYQANMGGVDRSDQMRSHFGGFAAQSHFKKWYKKTLMAVLDCMLLNGLHMWNMSCTKIQGRKTLSRSKFLQAVAHEMLNFKTESLVSPVGSPETGRVGREPVETGPYHNVVDATGNNRCIVCNLEYQHFVYLGKRSSQEGENAEYERKKANEGVRRKVSHCQECNINAHNFIVQRDMKEIHKFFPGMTCMEIFHSEEGKKLWRRETAGRKRKMMVNYTHDYVRQVRKKVEERRQM